MRMSVLALCVLGIACADERPEPGRTSEPIVEGDSPGGEVARPGPTRADRERERGVPDEAPTPPDPGVARLVLRAIEGREGQDGRGATVPSQRPVALDVVRAGGWPGRALPPTLHVGQLAFGEASHPDLETMRFVAADRASLTPGAEVYVQWGDDVASRVEVEADLAPSFPDEEER